MACVIEALKNLAADKCMVGGIKKMYFVALDDISEVEFDSTKPNEISEITLVEGKKFHYIGKVGKGQFDETGTTMTKGTYFNTYEKTVSAKVFNNTAETARLIKALANQDVVFVVENYQNDVTSTSGSATITDPAKYQVFGIEKGCQAETQEQKGNDGDVLNGWSLTFKETSATEAAVYLQAAAWTDAIHDEE